MCLDDDDVFRPRGIFGTVCKNKSKAHYSDKDKIRVLHPLGSGFNALVTN